MLLYAKQNTIGGRSYPVRHYPVAMRLRDRKGRAILCLRLSSKWGLVGRCTRSAFRRTPSHKNTLTLTKKRSLCSLQKQLAKGIFKITGYIHSIYRV